MHGLETSRIRVLVADDHPTIRRNLRELLDGQPDMSVIGVARNGREAFALAVELRPDVLVLDRDMPFRDGLQVVLDLQRECPFIGIVVYTVDDEIRDAALAAGASSFVGKDAPTSLLVGAVRAAAGSEAAALRDAIGAGRIEVALQPLVAMSTRRPTRFEAICRWPDATPGRLPSARLVAEAERQNLSTPLALLIARNAAARAREWSAEHRGLTVTVNLATATLLDASFPDQLLAALRAADCEPSLLGIGLTESVLMQEPWAAGEALTRLRALGMRVEIGRFGSGYSSLGRLIDLPIDAIKIDRRFVERMTTDHKSEAIVRACIGLAHDLGIEAVAEGVDTREVWDLLGALGCDTTQGALIAPPMSSADAGAWLRDAGADAVGGLAPSAARAAGCDVLVVDDEPAIREMVSAILRQEGLRVVIASNGADALRAVERARPAVVLLDMQMPILDGAGFTKNVRELGHDVPIIVMTAGSSAARWAQELRADGYLAKPFDIDALLAVTARYLTQQ